MAPYLLHGLATSQSNVDCLTGRVSWPERRLCLWNEQEQTQWIMAPYVSYGSAITRQSVSSLSSSFLSRLSLPLAEEIRLKICGSPDSTVSPSILLHDGDFNFLPWKPVSNFGDSREKRGWYVRGLLWKLVGNFGSHNDCKSDVLRLWHSFQSLLSLLHVRGRVFTLSMTPYPLQLQKQFAPSFSNCQGQTCQQSH